jgi:DNA modification methylase
MTKKLNSKLNIVYVPTNSLRGAGYNPRKWDQAAVENLTESIKKFGIVDPFLVNSAPARKGILIGGHFRWKIAKDLKIETVPVVFINIPDIEKEKELNLRLNQNLGAWDFSLLAKFDEDFLAGIGFSSEDLDSVFEIDEMPELFDLEKELKKLNIQKIEAKKGDLYQIGPHRILCGNSMVEKDVLRLMNGEKADMCLTDPPFMLNYLHGKKKKNSTEGFGYKRDRRYLGTDTLPPDFTEKWMGNISKIAKPDFSIIVYENWKNIRTIWNEMEKHFKVRNMIVWHLPNRVQGFAAKFRFFNKHDIAMVGSSGNIKLNLDQEEDLLQDAYESALFATSGSPHWENYEKGKKICPTDFIEFNAADEKSSGQSVIFGCKPVEILIPYLKVLSF